MTGQERNKSLNLDMELAQAQTAKEEQKATAQERTAHFGGNVTGQELPNDNSLDTLMLDYVNNMLNIEQGDIQSKVFALRHAACYLEKLAAWTEGGTLGAAPRYDQISIKDGKISPRDNQGVWSDPAFVARFIDDLKLKKRGKTFYADEEEITRDEIYRTVYTRISGEFPSGTGKKSKELTDIILNTVPVEKKEDLEKESMRALYEENPTPPPFLIPDILPEGLCVLAASPKQGKSYWCVEVAEAVSTGGEFWNTKARQGDVIYMALEDGRIEFLRKFKDIGGSLDALDHMDVITALPEGTTINKGLLPIIEKCKQERPALKLVIIDTLSCVKDANDNMRDAFNSDAVLFDKLKNFADKNELCILLVTHLKKDDGRKRKGVDPFERISGSVGISAKAVAMFMIDGEEETKIFHKKGRGMATGDFAISKEGRRWIKHGTVEEIEEQRAQAKYDQNPIVKTIRSVLNEQKRWQATPDEIWEETVTRTNGEEPSTSKRQMGLDLEAMQGRLMREGIRMRKDRGNKARFYTFEYTAKH